MLVHFSTQLTGYSTLPEERESTEVVFLLKCCTIFCQQADTRNSADAEGPRDAPKRRKIAHEKADILAE